MANRAQCQNCGNRRRLVAGNVTGVWVCRGCVSEQLAERLNRYVVINQALKDEISGATLEQLLQEAYDE